MANEKLRPVRSTSEVAVTLNFTRRTVQKWCEESRIAARRSPGGVWRIEVDEAGWPLEGGDDE